MILMVSLILEGPREYDFFQKTVETADPRVRFWQVGYFGRSST